MIYVDWTIVVSLPYRGTGSAGVGWSVSVPGEMAIAALGCSLPQSLLYAVFLSWL